MAHIRLKASTNRVRTSIALQGNEMWTNTIGLDSQAGANAAVEASLNAPKVGGGRAARRAAAADAMLRSAAVAAGEQAPETDGGNSPDLSRPLQFLSEGARARLTQALTKGGFDSAVNSYEGLLTLARSQGAVGGQNRGACKRCGQLGHLTKQCRNHLSTTALAVPSAADDAAKLVTQIQAAAGSLSSGSSSSSEDLGLSSDSASSDEERRRRRHRKKRKRSSLEGASKASKKIKKHKHKHGKKHKRRRKDSERA